MNKFTAGGKRPRKEFVGGRPKSDINNYAPKKRFDSRSDRGGERFNPKDKAPRPVELFQATCTTCGKSCEVPFRPDGSKPVLCRDCFAIKTKDGIPRNQARDFSREKFDRKPEAVRPVAQTVDLTPLSNQIAKLERSMSEVLELLKTVVEKPVVVEVVKTKEPKKVVVKKAPAKKVVTKKAVPKKAVKKTTKKAVAKK